MSRPISVPLVQGSPEWHAWRRTGVGSSDISTIVGDSPWSDSSSLYAEKLGYAAASVETPFMAAGKRLEEAVARWYREDTGNPVRRVNRGLRSREHSFAIASLDREALVDGRRRPLEIKTADAPGDAWGPAGSDRIPDHYLEQVQWQAAVTGATVVDLAVFFFRTRRMEVYRVPRDQALIDELIEYGAGFWRCVETRTPPEPTGRRVRRLLRDDEIEADPELTTLVQTARVIRDDLASAEKSKDEIDALIKQRLDRIGGVRGEGFRVHYRPNADSTRTDWEAVARAYRALIDRYEHGAPTLDPSLELDQIERDLTRVVPGARPLRITFAKSKEIAA